MKMGARKVADHAFGLVVCALALVCVLALAFVVYFIVREALPLFGEVGLADFLFGTRWMPIAYTGEPSFGIGNFIAGTLYVSLLALALALSVSVGAALFLSTVASPRARSLLYPFVDLLAGIPSVVYGFVGICVVVKLFLGAGVHTGSCVLAAAIVLAVMLVPFLVSAISETLIKAEARFLPSARALGVERWHAVATIALPASWKSILVSCVLAAAIVLAVMLVPFLVSAISETLIKAQERYLPSAQALGVERWHAVATIALPASWKSILVSCVLAIGRAMGETMAVMMVIGSANLFPQLLGKGETIASVIALEMGTAVQGSTHYHALFAAGLVLVVIMLAINLGIAALRRRLEKQGAVL